VEPSETGKCSVSIYGASLDVKVDAGFTAAAGGSFSHNPETGGATTMRFMIMVKATKDTEAGKMPEEKEKLFAAMATYHEELGKVGVLLDASGCNHPQRAGASSTREAGAS
jgi:hypothetical protein